MSADQTFTTRATCFANSSYAWKIAATLSEKQTYRPMLAFDRSEKRNTNNEITCRKTRLHSIVFCMKIFNDSILCLAFIQTAQKEERFLIICESSWKIRIARVHHWGWFYTATHARCFLLFPQLSSCERHPLDGYWWKIDARSHLRSCEIHVVRTSTRGGSMSIIANESHFEDQLIQECRWRNRNNSFQQA